MKDRQQLITAIEKACQKACPELMKLGFGCRVSETFTFKDGVHTEYGTIVKNMTYEHESPVVDIYWETGTFNRKPGSRFKILGKEPQLQHLLRTLNEKYKDTKTSIEITVFGMFIGDYYNWEEEPIIWNLSEGLNGQETETLQFIFDLLQ